MLLLLGAVVRCSTPAQQRDWAPNRPIEFVIAAGPGGGTDQLARTVQSIIQKYRLIDRSVIVTNKGGGSGSEAFVYAKGSAGNPHKVVFATKVRDTEEWKEWLRRGSQTDAFLSGTELADYIAADERRLRGQLAEDGWLVR